MSDRERQDAEGGRQEQATLINLSIRPVNSVSS
jgi:hypothetical protein